jgi:hypothetical protein
MDAVGATIGRANVAAAYLIHGTFSGNDPLGLLTELGRIAPGLSESLRKLTKGAADLLLGETGNYTAGFAHRLETALSAGAGRSIPVYRFNWSGQNTHIARADGAVRLIDQLATKAFELSNPAPSPSAGRAGEGGEAEPVLPPRILVWGHSHGGNVLALASNLLGGDAGARREFFDAAQSFYRKRRSARVDLPAWQRVEDLLASDAHPLRRVQLDMVTFGTPIRYGWETAGYGNLLHFVYHRPHHEEHHWRARFPPRLARVLAALEGDFMQHLGIAGSGFPGNPLAFRTFNANRRLRRLVAGNTRGWLLTRMKAGARVPDEGKTLLIDYDDPSWFPLRHIFGHALYTRSRWLPLQCELIAEEFYGDGMMS